MLSDTYHYYKIQNNQIEISDNGFVSVSYCQTVVAKNDYCDSIDIARSTIAILLLLWITIVILFSESCMLV